MEKSYFTYLYAHRTTGFLKITDFFRFQRPKYGDFGLPANPAK